jgi:probable O-glycosylation ligase (exosortase A-associated)
MLDAFLFLFVLGMLALGLKRPFIWVLAYLYIDIVAPQKIGWTLMPILPVSLIAFVAAFAGWALVDSKEGSRFTFRQGLLLALLAWCTLTASWSAFPVEAWAKWAWVWKAMVFAIFLPLTLRTKLRIEAAVLAMVLSIAAIIISGGIKTAAGGGGYGKLYFMVADNTGLYESSTISCVAIAVIPLILWLVKFGTVFPPDWRVKAFAGALIFAALLIPIGTEARTGLLCIGVLGTLMLRSVKHRFLYMAGAGLLVLAAIPFLPQSYTDRMSTISNHDEDESASTRVAVWTWTLEYAKAHPLGGGFDAYRANSFTYNKRVETGAGAVTTTEMREVTDQGRAYHSAYFEMLGEQGWPGLGLWLLIQGLGLLHTEQIRRRYTPGGKRSPLPEDAWKASLASALQQAQVVYLVGSLFIGIAYQPFVLMLIGVQIGFRTLVQRQEKLRERDAKGKARPASAATRPLGPPATGSQA